MIILEIENIGGLVGKHKFEFKEGVNEVLAPNAAGKTSLVKAILSLYAPASVPLDKLLNIDADEGYVRMVVNNNEFIRRFKKISGVVSEIEFKPVTNDERIKYVVLDPYLGEVVKRLASEANSDITDYLVRIFRLDEYQKKIDDLRNQINEFEKEKRELEESVEELKKANEEKRGLDEIRNNLMKELEKLKIVSVESVRSIQERINDLSRNLGEIGKRIRDIEETLLPAGKEKIDESQLEIDRLQRIINEFYSVHKEPEKEIEGIRKHIENIEGYVNQLKDELNAYLAGQDARIPVIRLANLSNASICPVCGSPVKKPKEFWSKREKEVEEDVKKSKEAIIRDYEERINKANNELKNLWKELEELQKKHNEIREIENIKLPSLTKKLNDLKKSLERYFNEISRLKNEKDLKEKELKELKEKLTEEEKEAAEKRSELERRLGEIEQQIKDLEERISIRSEAGKKLAEVNSKIEDLRKELENTEKALYSTLASMSDEFSKISFELIKELGFTWLKSIRIYRSEKKDITGELKRRFEVRITRVFPSGREYEQTLETLSTSERITVALIAVLVGYRLRLFEEYKGLAPILADEALISFDPERFEKVVNELGRYGKYVIITKLVEPSKTQALKITYK